MRVRACVRACVRTYVRVYGDGVRVYGEGVRVRAYMYECKTFEQVPPPSQYCMCEVQTYFS